MQIVNIASYRFVALDELEHLKTRLHSVAKDLGLKGTVLLAKEGINLFLSGTEDAITGFITLALESDHRLTGLDFKYSYSETVAFKRLKIKIKPEIVTFRQQGIDPALNPAPEITPQELKLLLDRGEKLVLLDTRNEFEYKSGSFKGALQLGNHNFVEFADKIESLPKARLDKLKDATIVSFCTGGIRCEKAAPYLQSKGFSKVVQLKGGILRYFELVGHAHYEGDCFVFDERQALDSKLNYLK